MVSSSLFIEDVGQTEFVIRVAFELGVEVENQWFSSIDDGIGVNLASLSWIGIDESCLPQWDWPSVGYP